MNKQIVGILIFASFLIISNLCNAQVSGDPITINLSKGFEHKIKKINLSEIAWNVEYIKLETKNDALLNRPSKVLFHNDNMIIMNRGNHELLMFTKSGRFIRKIGSRGKGPGEFVSLNGFYIDPDNYIFITGARENKIKSIIYNKHTSECMNVFDISDFSWIINDYDGGLSFWPAGKTIDGKLYMYVDIFKIKEYFKRNNSENIKIQNPEKNEALKTLIENSSIDDNPILMLVTLKE